MNRRIFLIGLVLTALFLVSGYGVMAGNQAKVTFGVSWYDVGAFALDGQPGVISVDKGWRGFSEVNRVVYDPEKISIKQMEDLLKGAGTYVRTIEEPE